ncbi:MAG: hypothetical protein IPH07_15740 [Deltaproteobacteria bacterium]|nr:hypothetical protein [Deltaproteobacteria bacterium]
MTMRGPAPLALLYSAGCLSAPFDPAAGGESSSTSSAPESSTPTDDSSSVAASDDKTDTNKTNTSGDTGLGSTSEVGSRCGDGVLDADEPCDDGNELDADGCNRDCTPSGEVQWVHAEPTVGRLRGVAGDAAGNTVAVGYSGDFIYGQALAAVRGLDADGLLAFSTDEDAGDDASFSDVRLAGDGTYWIFGTSPTRGWIRRTRAVDASDLLLTEIDQIRDADLCGDVVVVSDGAHIAALDADANVVWILDAGYVVDVAVGDGVVFALAADDSQADRRVLAYDAGGAVIAEGTPLLDANPDALAAIAGLGVAVVGQLSPSSDAPMGFVRLYTPQLDVQWTSTREDSRWSAVADAAGDLVVAGADLGTGYARPVIARLDPAGAYRWVTEVELTPPFGEARFDAVASTATGRVAASGYAIDFGGRSGFDAYGYVVSLSP